MSAVAHALSVSCSHVLAKRDRPPECADLRKSPSRNDEVAVKQAIANVIKDCSIYGYRPAWASLRLVGYDRVNHKLVYLVMRDEGWLLYRNEEKSFCTIKLDGKVAVNESDVRCCADGLE